MNISAVSFGSNNNDGIDIPKWVNNRHGYSSGVERTPKNDQFENQTGKSQKSQKSQNNKSNNVKSKSKKNAKKAAPIKMFVAGVLTTLLINSGVSLGVSQSDNKNAVTIPFDNSVSISELAETYNVDEDAILSYNGISEDTNIEELTEISIPSSYDYLQDEIDSLQTQLYKNNLSDEERDEITDQINACLEKQVYQQNIANVYTDGKYVYYEIKSMDEENTPEEIAERFSYGINVETFKDIFDIKDGEIKKYNDLDSVYREGESGSEIDKGYYDYSSNSFSEGDVIKVKLNSIDTDDISFDY